MKISLSVLALTASLLSVTASANAADLLNEDDVPYSILIDNETELTVDALGDMIAFCDACSVQFVDSLEPPVSVNETTTLIIRNAKFVVEN